MPPREPRGLYLKREYFSDFEFQTKLTAEQREVYMGLWQLADDAGWLDWHPEQIAAHIFRFSGADGPRLLEAAAEALKATGRLKVLACRHASLPRGEGHARPGRPSSQSEIYHAHKKHAKYSRKNSGDPIPHRTSPYLTSPHRGAPARAPAKGAAGRGGQPQSLRELVGDPEKIIGPRAAKAANS